MKSAPHIEEDLIMLSALADALDKINAPAAKEVRVFLTSTRKEIKGMTDRVGEKIRSLKEKFGDQLLDFFLSENAPRNRTRITNLGIDELNSDEGAVLNEVMKHAGINGMQAGSNCFRWLKILVLSMLRDDEFVRNEDLLGLNGNPATMHPWLSRIGRKLRETKKFNLVSVKDGTNRIGYTLRRIQKIEHVASDE